MEILAVGSNSPSLSRVLEELRDYPFHGVIPAILDQLTSCSWAEPRPPLLITAPSEPEKQWTEEFAFITLVI